MGSDYADRLIGDQNGNVFGGGGNDILTGGLGSDRFQWLTNTDGVDTITDFQKGLGGDILDVGNLIDDAGGGAVGDTATSFLRLLQSHGSTYLQLDADGSNGAYNFTKIGILQGVSGSDVTVANFVKNGNFRY